MPTPQVGDYIYGGVVFYVDTTNEYVLIESNQEVVGKKFNNSGEVEGTSTSDAIYGGIANTNAIIQHTSSDDAPQIISDYTQENTYYHDWYVASLDEMIELMSSGVTFTPFLRNTYYGTSSINGDKYKIIKGLTLDVLETSFQSTFVRFRYIRRQDYTPSLISVENIAGKEVAQRNDFLDFGYISYNNNVSISQKIYFRSRRPFSVFICFYIDMTKLADGFLATPQSLFGALPNLLSVRSNDNKIWYAGSSGVSNLTTIVNGVAYQLTFEDGVNTFIEIKGDLIRNITITIPQGESWFPMILGDELEIETIFNRDKLTKITKIHDLTTGNYYPGGGLKDLEIGRGYLIITSASFTHKFVSR